MEATITKHYVCVRCIAGGGEMYDSPEHACPTDGYMAEVIHEPGEMSDTVTIHWGMWPLRERAAILRMLAEREES